MPNQRISEITTTVAAAAAAMEVPVYDPANPGVASKARLAQVVPPFLRFKPPPTTGWGWFYQDGAASDVSADDGIHLNYPRTATAAITLVGLSRAAPSTPWTVKAAVQPNHFRNAITSAYQNIGIGVRQSSTGKLDAILAIENPYAADSLYLMNLWMTSPTVAAGSGGERRHSFLSSVVWLAISDDGTNLSFYHSLDGKHWHLFAQKVRTVHMAGGPNELAFIVGDDSSPAGFVSAGNLYSWEVTASGTP